MVPDHYTRPPLPGAPEINPVHDPDFKRLFGHPAAIESVVHRYASEHAEEIDFSTLEVAGTVATLRELTQIADETGSRYDRLMAECVLEMLISSGRITREQAREVTTMARVMTEYERSLEEYGKTWFRQGRDEGRAEIVCQLVDMKFGPDVAEELRASLGESEPCRISEAATAVIDCATVEDFLARVRRIRPT